MKKIDIAIIVVIATSFITAIISYPYLPEKLASHWNSQGEVNGYMSKFWGLFIIPFTMLILSLLFITIPKIDPLKENIEKFRKYYDTFILLFLIYMLAIYFETILWNFGFKINFNVTIPISISILFFYIGILLENAKRNWFIGIRTPWTLSNEKVWDKTHKIGGKLFKACAIITFFGAIFPDYALFFILIPVFSSAFYTIAYSYFEYQKEFNKD